MKKLIFAVLVLTLLAGCSWVNRMTNEHEFTMQLAVEAATARVLHEHPTWKSQTVEITGLVILTIDEKTVTDLASIEALIKSKIRWNRLLPEEQALLSALITQARKNVEDTMRAQGVKDPDKQLVGARKVLQWINDTAKRTTGT